MSEFVCKVCGKELTHAGALTGHMRSHKGKDPKPEPAPSGPALVPGLRRAGRLQHGQRTIKMLRPLCTECQGGDNVAQDWFLHCEHDPYVSVVEIKREVPKYKTENGRKLVDGIETEISYDVRPNWVEVALSPRINQGRGVIRGMQKGFILPINLRSPAFPEGIAPICQYRECYWQHGLKEYQWGVFCRDIEARLVGADVRGTILEYDNTLDPVSQEVRRKQLDEVPV